MSQQFKNPMDVILYDRQQFAKLFDLVEYWKEKAEAAINVTKEVRLHDAT